MTRRALLSLCLLALAACNPLKNKPDAQSGRYALDQDIGPDGHEVPADVANTPDAVPRDEPISRSGNPDRYEVFGKTYRVQKQRDEDFRESGKASWYGKKFHGHKTASGERYDMFAMTAAHKTLPLPSYVRVTRRDNGRSCIVRVNDRGPFHPGRIIDLSYAAAARLHMLHAGEAVVEIEVVTADSPPPAPLEPAPAPQPGWLQIAAYSDPINAIAAREQLLSLGIAAELRVEAVEGEVVQKLLAGPFASEVEASGAKQTLQANGFEPMWVTD